MDLEKKIVNIQRSTHTLFSFFLPIHEWFRLHSRTYYSWSAKPYARIVHWTVLFLYVISIISAYATINFVQYPKTQKIMAEGYDYPRWEWQNPKPTGSPLYAIQAKSASNIWAAGYKGTIIHYFANQWQQHYSTTSNNLNSISESSNGIAWAVGDSGTILKYYASSWTSQTSNTSTTLRKVYAVNDTAAWVVGNSGTILKTTNGGTTWTAQTSGTSSDLYSITAVDSTTAWVVGNSGTILKTTNGGTTWIAQTSGTSSNLRGIVQITSSTLITVGASGIILKSTDSGASWPSKTSGTTFDLTDVTYGGDVLYANTSSAEEGSTVYKSTSSGESWTNMNAGSAGAYWSISTNDGQNVFVVGDVDFKNSTDSGVTWSSSRSLVTSASLKIYAIDSDNAWATPDGYNVYKTTDGGDTWSQTPTFPPSDIVNIRGIAAASSDILWVVGDAGKIYKTINGGTTWTDQTSGTANALNSITISPTDNQTLWIVGAEGTIRKTTNGGTNWTTQSSTGSNDLMSVKAINNDTAWAVGVTGKVIKTTDGGANWVNKSSCGVGNLSKIDVDMDDPNIVWAVGKGSIMDSSLVTVCRTTDGGETNLSPVTFSYSNATDVKIFDQNNVWILDGTANIIKTTNGGSGWTSTDIGSYNNLRSIVTLDSNNVWVSGSNGTILKYHSVPNATATKLIVRFESKGQSFVDGTTTPSSVVAGFNVPVTVYAVDNNNQLDKGNASFVGFTTSDPDDTNPITIQLTQGGACVQTNRQPGDLDCGTGTATASFHRAGSWTITASDINNILSFGTSSEIQVTPAAEDSPYFFTSSASSALAFTTGTAGAASQIKLGLKDDYGNVTSPDTDRVITLSSTNSQGEACSTCRFSASADGPWTSTLNVTIPEGTASITPANNQNIPFYYLNYSASASVIKANSSGLNEATLNVSTDPGAVSILESDGSKIEFSKSSETVGNAITVTVTVKDSTSQKNPIPNAVVTLYSSNSNDTITSLSTDSKTNSSGQARFSISTSKMGSRNFTAKVNNSGSDVWLQSNPTLTFVPDAVDKITAGLSEEIKQDPDSKIYELTSGISFDITTALSDQYNNPADNTTDVLKITSSDPQAVLPVEYKMTSGDGSDNGTHTFSGLSLRTAGSQTITITDQNTEKSLELKFNVIPTVASAVNSSLTIKKQGAEDSLVKQSNTRIILGKDKATITAKILDLFGNPLSGEKVSISYEESFGEVVDDSATTDHNGLALFTYIPKQLGTATLGAIDLSSELNLSDKVSVEIIPDTIVNQVAAAVTETVGTAAIGIAGSVIQAAQSIAETAKEVAKILQESEGAKKIANISAPIVTTVASISLLPLVANVVGSAPAAVHTVNYGVSLTLQALGIRRRRKSWGKVYDSTTGRGVEMALVRLFDKKTMKLVTTAVTDFSGKYNFHPKDGDYVISVSKDGFIYPTQIFAKTGVFARTKGQGYQSDLLGKHYLGQTIKINNENPNLNLDIPIDPARKKASWILKIKLLGGDVVDLLTVTLSQVFIPTLIAGSLLSIFSTVVIPTRRNIILSTIYVIITLIYVIGREVKAKKFGYVFDEKTRKPIEGVVVSVFDKEYNALKETRVTDRFGRFSTFVQKGSYYLRVQKNGYIFTDAKNRESHKERQSFFDKHFGKYTNIYYGEILTFPESSFVKMSIKGEKNKSHS